MSVAMGAPRRRGFGRVVFSLVALLIVLGAGWTALWLYAAHQADAVIASWLAREASLGRQWTCPNRQISGFPFQMQLTCAEPHYAGREGEGSLKAFRAHAEVWASTQISAEADGPLVLQSQDGGRHVQANWAQAAMVLSGSPSALRGAAIELDQPDVALTAPNGQFNSKAAHALLTLAPSAMAGADDKTFDLHLKLDQAALAPLDVLTSNDAPVNVETTSTITALELGGTRTPIERMEAWRAAGGTVTIDNFLFAKGSVKLAAEGHVTLDAQHRASGKIDVSMLGMEPVLQMFHVPTQMLGFTALLGAKPVGHLESEGKSLNLPVTLSDGKMEIGPVKVMNLAPVY